MTSKPSSTFEREALTRGAIAQSVDDHGIPRLIRAVRKLPAKAGSTPEAAARAHLANLAPAYLARRAAADLTIVGTHTVGKSGATIISLRQQVGGVEVLHGDLRVLMDKDLSLLAIGGVARSSENSPRKAAFKLTAAQALAATINDRLKVATTAADVLARGRKGAWHDLTMRPRTDVVVGDAHAKQVLVVEGDHLTPAWLVEAYGTTKAGPDSEAFRVVLAADTGRVIERVDLTASDVYQYRVWADADGADDPGRPFEGPQESFAPHPTGQADGSQPAFVLPNLVSMDSFNTPPGVGEIDSWLPTAATESLGNNIDAYVDLNDAEDGFTIGDFRATPVGNVFGELYDVTADPMFSVAQQEAAITQLFYTNNWLHDWYYDSGFDEDAGNAQTDNFGRGGEEADVLLAEAQDDILGGSINNANMSTPQDGLSPRMQMFVWGGAPEVTLTVPALTPPARNRQAAGFGALTFDLTADIVVADDGVGGPGNGTATDGCQPLVNGAAVAGKIALIDRGLCFFEVKVLNAQNAGAIGVLVANNNPAGLPSMGDDPATNGVTIASFGISQGDGNLIKAALLGGPVPATMHRGPDGPLRDGDLDVGVISHEWGHYLHHRASDCFSYQCAALSEGFADFVALHGQLRPEDDETLVYPMGVYDTASFADSYYGIRRAPYSIDRTKNGFTFGHINGAVPLLLPVTSPPTLNFGDPAEVHNAGEVWTAMLWEVYVALLDAHPYDEARRLMSDYLVGGLLLAPFNATYTDYRDSILATIAAGAFPDDEAIAAQAFASRGAGSCAESPGPDDNTLGGVVENFEIAGVVRIGEITLDDDVMSCDDDDVLDAGETGTVTVQVANGGRLDLDGIDVSLSSSSPGVTVVTGSIDIEDLAAFDEEFLTFTVRLDPDILAETSIDFTAVATDSDACNGGHSGSASFLAAADDNAAVSATDTADSNHPAWTEAGDDGDATWNHAPDPILFNFGEDLGFGTVWFGIDNDFLSDTSLESPPLDVDATDDFVVTFQHGYYFEFDGIPWDGGVIELSVDAGANWDDVTDFGVDPGYTGVITDQGDNPLMLRPAFVGANPSLFTPGVRVETVTLDFGTQFAGQTVQLRFRQGADSFVGSFGWFLDNLAFDGITNTPFGEVVDDDTTCQVGPVANAGPDQAAVPSDVVTLDGTGSSDVNGDPITYDWDQIGGPAVTLDDDELAEPSFTAPNGAVDLRLTFELTVSDPWDSDTDTVVIDIDVNNTPPIDAMPIDAMPIDATPAPDAAEENEDAGIEYDAEPAPDAADPDDGDDDGCTCSTGGGVPSAGALLPLVALGFVLRRRRR